MLHKITLLFLKPNLRRTVTNPYWQIRHKFIDRGVQWPFNCNPENIKRTKDVSVTAGNIMHDFNSIKQHCHAPCVHWSNAEPYWQGPVITHSETSSDVVGERLLLLCLEKRCCDPLASLDVDLLHWAGKVKRPRGHFLVQLQQQCR